MAGFQQQLGHGQPHAAGADPADTRRILCHSQSPPSSCEKLVAAPNRRILASHCADTAPSAIFGGGDLTVAGRSCQRAGPRLFVAGETG